MFQENVPTVPATEKQQERENFTKCSNGFSYSFAYIPLRRQNNTHARHSYKARALEEWRRFCTTQNFSSVNERKSK